MMNRVELTENVMEQVNGSVSPFIPQIDFEELAKRREREEAEAAGFDYYAKNGVTILTKKF